MAIFRPGQRHRYHNILKRKGNKRSMTVVLSLTAMVDMFTVLVIFLLQNYNATGEILYIPKEVSLPKASRVLDLTPALVVTVSTKEILLDKTKVANLEDVRQSSDWSIPKLRDQARVFLQKAKAEEEAKLKNKITKIVEKTVTPEQTQKPAWNKVTIQADKSIDYLTLKKVMYSIYEAGGGPINFAVAKETESVN